MKPIRVRYSQVRECRLSPVYPWHAPTHESAPLWELHRRRTGGKKANRRVADMVSNNLANRRYCRERKFSLPARQGSKTLLVCMGNPAVLQTVFRHSTFMILQHGVPSCQAWQLYHEAQYACSKLNLSLAGTDANTELILLTAAMKFPFFHIYQLRREDCK